MAEGRALCDACRRYGRLFQHGTQQRGDGRFIHACRLAVNQKIGQLKSIKVGAPGGAGGGSTREIPVPQQLDYDMWLGQAPKIPYVGQAVGLGGWNHRSDYSPGSGSGEASPCGFERGQPTMTAVMSPAMRSPVSSLMPN